MSQIASLKSGHAHVALLEIRRGPFNYVNEALLRELADHLDRLDAESDCRTVVLAAEGRAFSAGAAFNGDGSSRDPGSLYEQAMRLFRVAKPVVAAVRGSAHSFPQRSIAGPRWPASATSRSISVVSWRFIEHCGVARNQGGRPFTLERVMPGALFQAFPDG